MKSGVYEVKFTTNVGTLGTAALVIKNQVFAGADGVQFYRGHFEQVGSDLTAVMEVTRHNFAVQSAFGDEALFTLEWHGKTALDTSFRATCHPPGRDLAVYVFGELLRASDE